MDLNSEQREAIEHKDGPLLIIAGAGTGKTLVITHRIAHLINTKLARPSEILALTFTEKAAREMEERVDRLVPYGYTDMWISTFHAFGDRVLREHGLEMGLTTDFRVLSRPEQVIFFREHLFEFPLKIYRPLGNPLKHIEALLILISRAKDEDVSPEEYVAYAEKLSEEARAASNDSALAEDAARQLEAARTYQTYQGLMAAHGYVDFGDQVNLALTLFREHPALLRQYQERFRYILVDEFQDTNYAQFQLLRLLAGGHRNITVVGDDDQSIYKFRGAAISNILNFSRLYPEARKIVLTDNYRSPQPILDAAYRLVRHNDPERLEVRENIDKRLKARTSSAGGAPVRHLHYDTLSTEADGVAGLIEEKVKKGDCTYGDFAILVRANNDADPFLRAMNMKGIPHRFTGNRGLYSRPEVRLLIAFLRVIADFHESRSLYYLASSDMYRMPMADLAHCMSIADRTNRSLYQVLTRSSEIPSEDFSVEGRATGEKLLSDLERYISLSRTHSAGQVLYRFITETGYLHALVRSDTPQAAAAVQNIARFFEGVRGIEHLLSSASSSSGGSGGEGNVREYVRHLDLLKEAGDDPPVVEAAEDAPAVNVLTVHKAKGLEFPVVFLVSLVDQRFPTRHRQDPIELPDALVKDEIPGGDIHLQEERRLFYVGMTRAQREIYLTSARDYGRGRARKVSRYVVEALALSPKELTPQAASALEEIARSAPLSVVAGGTASSSSASGGGPIPATEVIQLSYYEIDDYRTCPLKYKYRHILRVPLYQHHSIIYGSALHKAAEEYFRWKVAGKTMSVEDLIRVFEGAWRSEGFLSREHEEARLAAGRETLRRFHAREEERGLLPTHIEQDFSFMLENTRIAGRWDRIDERDGQVIIVDYKSSEVRVQKDADKRTKDNLQLALYSLAYRERFGRLPDRVELHFLETGLTGSAVMAEKDMEKTKDAIRQVAAGVRDRVYTARPRWEACSYCAYQEICPYTASPE